MSLFKSFMIQSLIIYNHFRPIEMLFLRRQFCRHAMKSFGMKTRIILDQVSDTRSS